MPFNMGSTQHEVSPKAHSATPTHQREITPGSSSSPPQTDADLSMIPVHVSLEHPTLGPLPWLPWVPLTRGKILVVKFAHELVGYAGVPPCKYEVHKSHGTPLVRRRNAIPQGLYHMPDDRAQYALSLRRTARPLGIPSGRTVEPVRSKPFLVPPIAKFQSNAVIMESPQCPGPQNGD